MSGNISNHELEPISVSTNEDQNEVVWRTRIAGLLSLDRRRNQLLSRAGLESDSNPCDQTSQRSGFRIAIIGAPKAGKSCLLNAIIGSPILPMPAVPASTGPIWLKWGEEARAILHNENGLTRELALTDLESPEETASLEVRWPLPLCEGGVEFIEIPAPTSADSALRQELASADLVMLVMSCRALASKSDFALIETIAQFGLTEILFVCNYADGLNPEDRRGLEARCAALLQPRTTLPGQAIFFVSGHWALEGAENQDVGLVQRSGIHELRHAVGDYISTSRHRAKAVKLAATERVAFAYFDDALKQATRKIGDERQVLQAQLLSLSSASELVHRKRELILSRAGQFQETTCTVASMRVQNFLLDYASLVENRKQAAPSVVESVFAAASSAGFERLRHRETAHVETELKAALRDWIETDLLPSISHECAGLEDAVGLSLEDFSYAIGEMVQMATGAENAAPERLIGRFDTKRFLADLAQTEAGLNLSVLAAEGDHGISSIFYTAVAVATAASAAGALLLHVPLLITLPLAFGGTALYSHSRVTAELTACDRELANATAEAIRVKAGEITQAIETSIAYGINLALDTLRRQLDQMADGGLEHARASLESIQSRISQICGREAALGQQQTELSGLRAELDEIRTEIGLLAGV